MSGNLLVCTDMVVKYALGPPLEKSWIPYQHMSSLAWGRRPPESLVPFPFENSVRILRGLDAHWCDIFHLFFP